MGQVAAAAPDWRAAPAGYGDGYGDGDGSGYVPRYGYGSVPGYGYGYGPVPRYGSGSGYGSGYGDDISPRFARAQMLRGTAALRLGAVVDGGRAVSGAVAEAILEVEALEDPFLERYAHLDDT